MGRPTQGSPQRPCPSVDQEACLKKKKRRLVSKKKALPRPLYFGRSSSKKNTFKDAFIFYLCSSRRLKNFNSHTAIAMEAVLQRLLGTDWLRGCSSRRFCFQCERPVCSHCCGDHGLHHPRGPPPALVSRFFPTSAHFLRAPGKIWS